MNTESAVIADKMMEPAGSKACRFRVPIVEAPMAKDTDVWPSLRAKIEAHLDRTDPNGCWLWTRAISRGYGHVWWSGKLHRAHRAYVKELGWDVPDGMHIDHLCRVRHCCNPDHLEVVTPLENARRGIGLGKRKHPVTHCPYGHPYDEVNTYLNPSGSRACRKCHVRWSREYWLKTRAKK